MAEQPAKKDWSANQYLKFGNERTRAVYDLVSQVAPHVTATNPRIYDLGCGPANSTKVLLDTFPSATITGMDSSPDMLQMARSTLPFVEFEQGDLSIYSPSSSADLLFSNAVFHWLRSRTRIPTLTKLFANMKSGGVLAIQVPDNYYEGSHEVMREIACMHSKSWSKYFPESSVGNLEHPEHPDLDPIESPDAFYDALSPHAQSVNIWRTNYQHVLKDHAAIVEWVKATGLQPYLNRIEDGEAKDEFLKKYEQGLQERYRQLKDGKVLLGYPRLFVVAVKK